MNFKIRSFKIKLPLTDIPGVKREYHFDLKGVYKKGTTT